MTITQAYIDRLRGATVPTVLEDEYGLSVRGSTDSLAASVYVGGLRGNRLMIGRGPDNAYHCTASDAELEALERMLRLHRERKGDG